jgi:hypothetical protein
MTTLNFKMGSDGFSGLYQIDGRGPWRNEYKTDSMLENGTYDVCENGKKVGVWIQGTMGHRLELAEGVCQ